MKRTWKLASGIGAAAVVSTTAFVLCPNAVADPTPPQPLPAQQLPGLPALTQLSPIIQQAAADPQQAQQLLMAAAAAFTHSPAAPDASKNVAASVNQLMQEPTAHIPPVGVEPGAQAHLPTGIDPAHAAGPSPEPAAGPNVTPVAAPVPPPPAPAAFSPDSPPTQDFMYPSIGTGCAADGGNVIATALSVAGPAKIPAPGPQSGQTAYVFTAVGTPGPAEEQKLPLNVTWVNLTTGKSGSATLKPQPDINPDGPTTLTAIADTGSGSILSTIFGQVTTKEKQCQFMPTIGSTVVP
ncbi:hypothetical protein AWC26_06245 [Mycobacterium shimoidei]|nr:hypothetical protein BHQ16_15595 [Mycobacterium shimoidei]ORW81935.1 hypothetical protein AWC26_06245 [Mycobacterium shimoidei]